MDLPKISVATGYFRGHKIPIDSVKKTVVFQGMKIKIDRPKGFVMEGHDDEGKAWRREYTHDYGFLPKTEGGDGEGVDVFLGPDPDAHEAYWIIQLKKDGSFDEYKVLLGFKDKKSAKKVYAAHVPMRFFGGIVAMRVQMMKALLGQEPVEKIATRLAFLDELGKIFPTYRARGEE